MSQVANSLNGYAFINDQQGIASSAAGASQRPYYSTSDGGLTWGVLAFKEEAWQPLAFNNAIYVLTDLTNALYRTDDMGSTWSLLYTFPFSVVGSLGADSTAMYAQGGGIIRQQSDLSGFHRSIDKGITWESICGPSNSYDTRFFASDYGVWAGDLSGGLWFNRTKQGSGPRLQIEKNNAI
ncbi:MAG: hypothetical protein Q8896_05705, partial [Bacteroidota bacterium]|nr:hypothetical protein [Bacteroidota bacterium]